MGREKLKAADSDLQITNAQTKEEYTDDNALIPKNSSVIVRRIPIGGVKSTSKTYVISRTEPVMGTTKAVCKNTITLFLHNCFYLYNVFSEVNHLEYPTDHSTHCKSIVF